MAEIEWSKRANKLRIAILTEGAHKFGMKVSNALNRRIEDYVNCLSHNPYMGTIEPLLEGRRWEYRSLVVHEHYKLVYRIVANRIYIVDLWDTHREPESLSRRIKSK